MSTRKAHADWRGNLEHGNGKMELAGQELAFSFKSRFEDGTGTNPEELIGAAHAGCFSMAFSHMMDEAGHTPERVQTTAAVTLKMVDGDPTITSIKLTTEAKVPGIDQETFDRIAEEAKAGCPVSRALAGVDIELDATLL